MKQTTTMKKTNKKGQLEDLGGIVVSLGYIAILAAVIFLIIAASKTQVVTTGACEDMATFTWNETTGSCCGQSDGVLNCTIQNGASAAYNATSKAQSATSDIPNWFPIVVITLIGGLLLTLVRFFKQEK